MKVLSNLNESKKIGPIGLELPLNEGKNLRTARFILVVGSKKINLEEIPVETVKEKILNLILENARDKTSPIALERFFEGGDIEILRDIFWIKSLTEMKMM